MPECDYLFPNWIIIEPIFNEKKKIDKCTFCIHRLKVGLEPACVRTCMGYALSNGRLPDVEECKPKKLMMQDKASPAMSIYRKSSFILDTAEVMPDHLGAQLNFFALLRRNNHTAGEQNERYIALTQRFLSEHLVKWVSSFTEHMENAADLSFYNTLARVTRTMIMAAFVWKVRSACIRHVLR